MGRRIRGLSEIRTNQKNKMQSKPRMKGTKYLKLYIMDMEKQRLDQYKAVIDKTQEQTEASLEEVQREMEEIASSLPEGPTTSNEETRKRTPLTPKKAMLLHY